MTDKDAAGAQEGPASPANVDIMSRTGQACPGRNLAFELAGAVSLDGTENRVASARLPGRCGGAPRASGSGAA